MKSQAFIDFSVDSNVHIVHIYETKLNFKLCFFLESKMFNTKGFENYILTHVELKHE